LFGYDETGIYPEIDLLLASYLKRCFKEKMSDSDFGRMHPPPNLNPHDVMDTRILWKPPGFSTDRFVPGRLLPLFVFALRAAFQHAWLTSFFKAATHGQSADFAPVAETITLEEQESSESYRMTFTFPNPVLVADLPLQCRGRDSVLPWGIDWERQIGHYRGHSGPWKANAQRDDPNKRLIITIET